MDIVAALQAGTYMPGPVAAAADVVFTENADERAHGDVMDVDLEEIGETWLETL